MQALRYASNEDDEEEADELLWVKAGEPGEKPTIIRQIRSESSTSGSSRDNSGDSTGCNTIRRNLLTVENGTVYRTNAVSSDSIHGLEKLKRTSSDDSRVIVVNVSEQVYPANLDKQRIRRWKELHSPNVEKKFQIHNNNTNSTTTISCDNTLTRQTRLKENLNRPNSQPIKSTYNTSPDIKRPASSSSPFNRVKALKGHDEGYTSLTEDCKDSDNESVRSKSLPSSWRPCNINKQRIEQNMQKYGERMTINSTGACFRSDDSNKLLCKEAVDKSKQKTQRIKHHVENVVEICTCFVCLRSAIYHMEDEDDTDSLVDHPCSCEQPSIKCCGRWSVIGLMVLFLPFLIFYPPLKCCLNIHNSRKKRSRKKKEKKLPRTVLK